MTAVKAGPVPTSRREGTRTAKHRVTPSAASRIAAFGIAAASAAGLYAGWRTFWFLTDDAYIAFRYVSNSIAGYGYVWNPPPFQAVEGYTSFLWVVILDLVWRISGASPPESANWISLAFGAGSLALSAAFFWRMQLPANWGPARYLLLAVTLLGILSNRTFLAWLSSGLETALFNCCLLAWLYTATHPGTLSSRRTLLLSSCAALTALVRPEGMLVAAATPALIALQWLPALSKGGFGLPRRSELTSAVFMCLPLLAVPVHMLWRYYTYDSWLPNTYYAKHLGSWPESGARYLGAFVLEYSLWFWAALGIAAAGFSQARDTHRTGVEDMNTRVATLRFWLAVATLATIASYYTFEIGGDHFEFRVYSYAIPLLFVSAAWFAARISQRATVACGLLACFVCLSWPIPWTHYWQSRDLATRVETKTLVVPIAQHFPAPFDSLVEEWDDLQAWLIPRAVGVRHQEHKVFLEHKQRDLPTREVGAGLPWSDRHVVSQNAVGLVGWVLPNVAVIDLKGLNDAVIARYGRTAPERKMAHDRIPPAGYVQCFKPNVVAGNGTIALRERTLTDLEIKLCSLRR